MREALKFALMACAVVDLFRGLYYEYKAIRTRETSYEFQALKADIKAILMVVISLTL